MDSTFNCDFGLARIADPRGGNDVLTEYVATRWYHALEVLLNYETYGPAMDMWSVGCILAELILRKPVFPGTSTMNQLQLINEIIGSPTESDLEQCKNQKAKRFMESLPSHPKVPMPDIFPTGDPDEVDLVGRMLTWDPRVRITVEDALEHPFLAQLHDPYDEPVTFPLPDFEFERQDITLGELRMSMWQEVLRFHPEFGA
jgi:mitogen-activated protein kinase 1/3